MQTSTFFTLIAEYGTGDIPLKKCCDKYFGLSEKKAGERARHQQLPAPAFRGGSQKTEWLISAIDLAKHIDDRRTAALQEWKAANGH